MRWNESVVRLSAIPISARLKQSSLIVILAFVAVFFVALNTAPAQGAVGDLGCCIDPVLGCLSVQSQQEADSCTDQGGVFRQGELCEEDPFDSRPVVAACTLGGCCCFSGDYRIGVTQEFCVGNLLGTFHPDAASCAETCQVGGTPSDDNATDSCIALDGYFCQPGDSIGNVIPNAADAAQNLPLLCYDAPCTSAKNACERLPAAIYCPQGTTCRGAAWLDESDRCCADVCIDATCNDADGYWCSQGQTCAIQDITSLIRDFTGRTASNQLCCYGGSPLEACQDQNTCQATSTHEAYCNDGVDNDCDGQTDVQDAECSARISGSVTLAGSGNPVPGATIRAFHDNGDIATAVTQSDGTYMITSVAIGTHRVVLASDLYSAPDKSGIGVSAGSSITGVNFIAVLQTSGAFTGVVEDEDGFPLSGATVRVLGTSHRMTTGSDGSFRFDGLDAGTQFQAFAFKQGYEKSDIYSFTPPSQAVASHTFVLSSLSCHLALPAPFITSLAPLKGLSQVTVEWSGTGCNPDGFRVYRCAGDEVNCTKDPSRFLPIKALGADSSGFIDTGVAFGKTYTYRVGADYAGQEVLSGMQEIYVGDARCAGQFTQGEFCIVDGLRNIDGGFTCDDMNRIQQVVDCGLSEVTCANAIEEDTGTVRTACVDAINCAYDERAQPFGLYFTDNICHISSTGAHKPCFSDVSRTNVDSCFNCDPDMTCADYASRSSCETDRCQVAYHGVPAECEWEYTNIDLNIGICKDATRDLCGMCDDPANRIFGMCNLEQCSALGDCHYVTSVFPGEPGSCEACDDVTCYDYTTAETCQQGTVSLSSSDNRILGGSQDSCGINNCRWMPGDDLASGLCVKDANANGADDCDVATDFSYNNLNPSIFQVITCRSDRAPANTTAIVPLRINPDHGAANVTFVSFDQLWQADESVQDLYFCIEPEGSDACQVTGAGTILGDYDKAFPTIDGQYRIVIDGLDTMPGQTKKTYQLTPGANTIKYYSVDWANNIETVQETSFVVDMEGPDVNITYFISPKGAQGDIRSDVTIIAELDEPAICVINLRGCDEFGSCLRLGDPNENPELIVPEHHRTISDVEDGIYTVEAICADILGNQKISTQEIIIDADPRATNPQPRNAIDYNDVTLSVDTTDEVECRITTDVNDDFVDASPLNIMDRVRSGTKYRHTLGVTLMESKPYVYYAVCNYDPVSKERIAFSLDQLPPELTFETGSSKPFDFSSWHTVGQVFAICDDKPEGGFGCQDVKYCLTRLLMGVPEDQKEDCVPGTVIPAGTSGKIVVDLPQRLCAVATERNTSSMGGQSSLVACHDVLVDKYAPIIVMDSFPTTTQTSVLDISGSIIDVHYQQQSWSLPAASARKSVFLEDAPNMYLGGFDLFADISLQFGAEEQEDYTFALLMRHDGTRGYAALIDPRAGTFSIERQDGDARTTLAQTSLSLVSGTTYRIHVSAQGPSLVAEIAGVRLTVDDNQITHGNLGVMTRADETPPVSIQNVRVQDHSLVQSNTLSIEKDGHLYDTFMGTSFIKQIMLSDTPLTHGQSFTITLSGEDLAGRKSNVITQTVHYDIEGPSIHNVTFVPTANDDPSFIEYRTDAIAQVVVEDDFGSVDRVTIQVADQSVDLVRGESGSWTGLFPASQLYIAHHDVLVIAEDEAGNVVSKVFEDRLFIDDRINPSIIFLFEQPYRTKSLNPELSINTTEETRCEISYSDASGTERVRQFDRPGGTQHAVTLTDDLLRIDGEEVEVKALVSCLDTSDNEAQKEAIIIVDYRPPVIGARGNDFDLILDDYDRTSKTYTVLTRSDRQLLVVADEAVKCRYDTQDVPYESMTIDMANKVSGVARESDHSERILLADGDYDYWVSCEDAVGNVATVSRHVRFDVDRFAPAVPVDVSPVGFSNEEFPIVTLKTMRQIPCVGQFLNGERITFSRSGGGPVTHRSDKSFTLIDGSHIFTLTCGSSSQGIPLTTTTYSFVKDTVSPTVVIVGPSAGDTIQEAYADVTFTLSEAAHVRIINGYLRHAKDMGMGTHTVRVPLNYGANGILVSAQDDAGNVGQQSITLLKQKRTPEVIIDKFIADATVGRLDFVQASLRNPELASGSITISVTDDQDAVIPGQLTAQGATATYTFDDELTAGRYDVVATMGSSMDTTSFVIDPFAEELTLDVPTGFIVTSSPGEFSGVVDYQNVIIIEDFIINNRRSTLRRIFESFEALPPLVQGSNAFELMFENELGHESALRNAVVLDSRAPRATVKIQGGDTIALGPQPIFETTFDEAARIHEAFIIPANVSGTPTDKRIAITADWGNGFHLSYDLATSGSLPGEGAYDLALLLEDQYGNLGPVQYFRFSYLDEPLVISLVSPTYGYGSTKDVEFTVSTSRQATCRFDTQDTDYGFMRFFNVTDGTSHTSSISLFNELEEVAHYVKCDDGMGNIDAARFNLSYDTTAPVIASVGIDRGDDGVIIEYPLSAGIIAQVDDEVRCRYGEPGTPYLEMERFDNYTLFTRLPRSLVSALEDSTTYTYDVVCENRAELISTPETLTFSVDLSRGTALKLLSPTPNSYTANTSLDIELRTNKRALPGTCKWGTTAGQIVNLFDDDIDSNHLHVVYGHVFPEGKNTLYFRCLIDGEEKTLEATFTVDTSAPEFISIDDGKFTYHTDQLDAEFEFEDNESGIAFYEYAIGHVSVIGTTNATAWQSVKEITKTSDDSITVKRLELDNLKNYYWAVRATNKAGLKSGWYSSDGITVDISKLPSFGSCTNGIKDQDETDIDCGGLRCPSCSDGKVCLSNLDCAGRSCQNGICSTNICSNGVLDGNESDVDCGGPLCVGCGIGGICVEHDDCGSGYCEEGVCAAATCEDQVKNGLESDVDCGGASCDTCSEGLMCVSDTDCSSGVCGEENICLPGGCSDGVKNGNETDVDCGGDACNTCRDGRICSVDSDCSSDYCLEGMCEDSDLKDSDNDGMPDWYEIEYALDPYNPADAAEDANNDGLLNIEKYDYRNNEFNLNGDPLDPWDDDYDDDGYTDKRELDKATDATNKLDFPKAQFWSLLLFIIAIVLIGGAIGYLGYSRYTARKDVGARQSSIPGPARQTPWSGESSSLSSFEPPTRKAPSLRDKMKEALKDKIRKERELESQREHKGITSAFGETKQQSGTPKNKDSRPLDEKMAEVTDSQKSISSEDDSGMSLGSNIDKLKHLSSKAGDSDSKKPQSHGNVDKLASIIDETKGDIEKKQKTKGQKSALSELKKIEKVSKSGKTKK